MFHMSKVYSLLPIFGFELDPLPFIDLLLALLFAFVFLLVIDGYTISAMDVLFVVLGALSLTSLMSLLVPSFLISPQLPFALYCTHILSLSPLLILTNMLFLTWVPLLLLLASILTRFASTQICYYWISTFTASNSYTL